MVLWQVIEYVNVYVMVMIVSGKYDIDGDRLFYMIFENMMELGELCSVEYYVCYFDIQIVL